MFFLRFLFLQFDFRPLKLPRHLPQLLPQLTSLLHQPLNLPLTIFFHIVLLPQQLIPLINHLTQLLPQLHRLHRQPLHLRLRPLMLLIRLMLMPLLLLRQLPIQLLQRILRILQFTFQVGFAIGQLRHSIQLYLLFYLDCFVGFVFVGADVDAGGELLEGLDFAFLEALNIVLKLFSILCILILQLLKKVVFSVHLLR